MKKLKKTDLREDSVQSTGFHCGIELETYIPGVGSGEHDDDACYDSRRDSQREYMSSLSNRELIAEYIGIDSATARQVADYFDAESFIDDYMSDYDPGSCDDDHCSYRSDDTVCRDTVADELRRLTGNASFKCVADGSLGDGVKNGESDVEVCWNYFASKETVSDNEKILKYLTDKGARFDRRCGLHINLNNYLGIQVEGLTKVSTNQLDFLFNFVAASRRENTYCNSYAISNCSKYSMIYDQRDRFEFRFFSPTFDAEKLNNYVALANVVYRRLAGKNVKMSRKLRGYFIDKMVNVNGLTHQQAVSSCDNVDSLASYSDLVRIDREELQRAEQERAERIQRDREEIMRRAEVMRRLQAEPMAVSNV